MSDQYTEGTSSNEEIANSAQSEGTLVRTFDTETLRSIVNLDDAVALLEQHGITIRDAANEIGDGFTVLENKDELLGKQFIVISAQFAKGDFGGGAEFCILRVVSTAGKFIVTDGGTGIATQVRDCIARTGDAAGLLVKRGLRKSEYDTDKDGKPTSDKALVEGKGVTYYLAV